MNLSPSDISMLILYVVSFHVIVDVVSAPFCGRMAVLIPFAIKCIFNESFYLKLEVELVSMQMTIWSAKLFAIEMLQIVCVQCLDNTPQVLMISYSI